MTGGVTRDLKPAEKRKYKAKGELGSSPDHLSRDCPTRFDVRTLTTDELQEILEGRLAQLDVVSEESPSEEKAESQKLEDFPTSSE